LLEERTVNDLEKAARLSLARTLVLKGSLVNRKFPRAAVVAAILATAIVATAPAAAKDGKNAAFIGGAAAGVVGGVLLNQALQGSAAAEPQPTYVEPAPRYVRPAPQPVYVEPASGDRDYGRISRLRAMCDDGSRKACIRFGMILGQNREREAQWRRSRPDFYNWERYD
jgi:hypothetical protein